MRRVLVVDDDPDMRMLLAAYLQMAGWEVFAASGGKEALQIAAQNKPDAVMLDLQMPDMDGVAVLGKMRESDQTKDIPAILFSCKVSNLNVDEYLKLGFAGVLPKSFSVERLTKDISNILGWD